MVELILLEVYFLYEKSRYVNMLTNFIRAWVNSSFIALLFETLLKVDQRSDMQKRGFNLFSSDCSCSFWCFKLRLFSVYFFFHVTLPPWQLLLKSFYQLKMWKGKEILVTCYIQLSVLCILFTNSSEINVTDIMIPAFLYK